jgi:[pyruvate, water dikinase]-phosphate phosphotransferase / [pyruvate, water dikinase] kinase
MTRQVFFVSDGTGITCENLGNSLLSQFPQIDFERKTIPNVNCIEKAEEVNATLKASFEQTGEQPIVLTSLVDPAIRDILIGSNAIIMDLFHAFLRPLEKALNTKSSHTIGQSHGIADEHAYTNRINALNFALACDDGIGLKHYQKADIILLGVSRSGKTPTSLYLALQFGLFAANFPLTEDELMQAQLPQSLETHRDKLFGLIINPKRLTQIRQERRPNSEYANDRHCQHEIQRATRLYHQENIPFLDVSQYSIEEIATRILSTSGIKRRI